MKQAVKGKERPHPTQSIARVAEEVRRPGKENTSSVLSPLRYPLAFQAASRSTANALAVLVAFRWSLFSVLPVSIPPHDQGKGNLFTGRQNLYKEYPQIKKEENVLWKLGTMTNACNPSYLGNRGSRPSQIPGLPWHLEKPYHPTFKRSGDVGQWQSACLALGLSRRTGGKRCCEVSSQKGRRVGSLYPKDGHLRHLCSFICSIGFMAHFCPLKVQSKPVHHCNIQRNA